MRPSLLITLCIAAGLAVGGAALFLFPQHFGLNQTDQRQVKSSGKALIKSKFSLTDHKGKRVSEKSYAGKFMLIYFGYTFCPDVCPTELQVMSTALDTLGAKADRIQPVFITVDPERDTVPLMAEYMTNFYKSFVGLTGTADEIKATAKNYRVFYGKAKGEENTEDYLMDHSSIIYLINERGEFVKHFSYGVKPEELADGIKKFL